MGRGGKETVHSTTIGMGGGIKKQDTGAKKRGIEEGRRKVKMKVN